MPHATRYFFNRDGRQDAADDAFHNFPASIRLSCSRQVLTSENYDGFVNDKSKDVLVLIYAPWCGKLRPTWTWIGGRRGRRKGEGRGDSAISTCLPACLLLRTCPKGFDF